MAVRYSLFAIPYSLSHAMPTELHGHLTASDASFAIVVSRFNDLVTKRLLEGAVDMIVRHGGSAEKITIAWVPGSFEIPLAAAKLAKSGKYSAVICLGAVIQGSTSHHEYINSQVAAGIMSITRESGIPVTFGVLTCESMDQALDRAGGKAGNKGHEAALAAIEMVNLLRQI
jgi:6,7-dimethyl-8-ribityllumazine synthase